MMPKAHGTAVAIGGKAVLIVGASGTGKSDLALRLIDRGAILVADDYVELAADAGEVRCTSPATIAGRIEVRGVGIAVLPFTSGVPLALVVDLDLPRERMPLPQTRRVEGIGIALIAIDAHAPSGPIKVELALSGAFLPLD